MKAYAGIGSRKTPYADQMAMTHLASLLAGRGYLLRSGGAEGADRAFETGARAVEGAGFEVYVPNMERKRRAGEIVASCLPKHREALTMAAAHHPNWGACGRFARQAHARNCFIILGPELNEPVEFVVCWTYQGRGRGGTGQAIRVAKAHDIPVWDLGERETWVRYVMCGVEAFVHPQAA